VNILDLFNPNVYQGGATVLYALRQVVGEDAFYAIERRWVRRYEGDSASTEDFIALASRVAHRDLGPFLRDWLYGSKTPPMPGHPDWTVTAPGAAPAAPKARTAPTTAASLEQLAKR
jgi:aminopeptidase N